MTNNIDPFQEHIERSLSFESSYGGGGMDALKAKEEIAWKLHESGSSAGSMLLGDELLSSRCSHARSDIQVVPFAKSLVKESFTALNETKDKTHWDWYFLGIAHQYGRGTDSNYSLAAECFHESNKLGNPYAEYEEIWSRYLATGRVYEAISRLRDYQGRLIKFAEPAANTLSLLALGPTRSIGSYEHAWRISEISGLLHRFSYHDQGDRQINIAVEKEMRADVNALESMDSNSAASVLYLIAKSSRRNPTSNEPQHWLRMAATPDDLEFLDLLKHQETDYDALEMLTVLCEEKGWTDTELGQYLTVELKQMDEWD